MPQRCPTRHPVRLEAPTLFPGLAAAALLGFATACGSTSGTGAAAGECASDSDCPAGTRCIAGACQGAAPDAGNAATPECESTLDCDPGEVCFDNECMSEKDAAEAKAAAADGGTTGEGAEGGEGGGALPSEGGQGGELPPPGGGDAGQDGGTAEDSGASGGCDPSKIDCNVTQACQASADCPCGFYCKDGQCAAGACQCTGCPSGRVCREETGLCAVEETGPPPPPAEPCKANSGCPAPAPICEVSTGTCFECLTDNDCLAFRGPGFACTAQRTCDGTGAVVKCSSNTECAGIGVCDMASGRCVGCISDAGCPGAHCDMLSYTCKAGGGCSKNADCPPGEICDVAAATCITAGTGACQSDFDCDSGEYCDALMGACQPQSSSGAFCSIDADCAPYFCYGGECVECERDAHCGAGQTCDTWTMSCVTGGGSYNCKNPPWDPSQPGADGDSCFSSSDCQPGMVCIEDFFGLSASCRQTCTSSFDCCNGGFCSLDFSTFEDYCDPLF